MKPTRWRTLIGCGWLALTAGCQSPHFTVQTSYAGSPPAVTPQPLGIALVVKDRRPLDTRGPARANRQGEVIARGEKGSIFLEGGYENLLRSGLEEAFRAAGFRLEAGAPLVVEANLQEARLEATEFTHWRLPTEQASSLDAVRWLFGWLFPRKVRETTVDMSVNFVIRKGEQRLGFFHPVRKRIMKESRDRAVVEQALTEGLKGIIDEGVRRSAPDIPVVARVPVSDEEIRTRQAALDRQQLEIDRVARDFRARELALTEDRVEVDEFRRELADQHRQKETALAETRRSLEEKSRAIERDRELAKARLEEVERGLVQVAQDTQQSEAHRKELQLALQSEKAAIETQRLAVESRQRELDSERAALVRREQQLAAAQANLEAQQAELEVRNRENQRIQRELKRQAEELADRDVALKEWEQQLREEAEREPTKPPAAMITDRKPRIVLTRPEIENSETTLLRVSVEGVAFDDREVNRLRFLVNDEEARGVVAEATEPDVREFEFSAALRNGANEIAIEAWDDVGNVVEKRLSVQHKKTTGECYVVAIGINDFEDANIPPLNFAKNDVEVVVKTLQKGLDIPDENISILTNEDATRRNILTELGRNLRTKLRKDDTVVIYFSGHGACESDETATDGVEKYFLTYDADHDDFAASSIRMSEMVRILRRLTSERVVFLADTCYSGEVGGRSYTSGTGAKFASRKPVRKQLEGPQRVIMTASKDEEIAQEKQELGHGVFSYYVVQGLQSAADADKNRQVTIIELFDYVSEMVQAATKGDQHPQMSETPLQDFVLSLVRE